MTDQTVAPAAPAESAPAPESQVNEAPIADSAEGEAAPKADEPSRREPSRIQKRIDDLTRARYEAERRAAELEQQMARQQRQEQFQRQAAEIDASKPRPDQFANLVEYGDAIAAWSTKRAVAEAHATWEQRQEEMAAVQAQATMRHLAAAQQIERENSVLGDKFATAVKKFPDFQKVVNNPELPSVRGTPAYLAMLDADNFADIAYHLAKSPADYDRIFPIADPIRATREIARLDTQSSGNEAT